MLVDAARRCARTAKEARLLDLLERFERETPARGHPADPKPRKGLRGPFDRLTAVLDGNAGDHGDRRHDGERRRRDEQDFGFD